MYPQYNNNKNEVFFERWSWEKIAVLVLSWDQILVKWKRGWQEQILSTEESNVPTWLPGCN
jgi:hypothetical protein